MCGAVVGSQMLRGGGSVAVKLTLPCAAPRARGSFQLAEILDLPRCQLCTSMVRG